jgi:hypothetical protein
VATNDNSLRELLEESGLTDADIPALRRALGASGDADLAARLQGVRSLAFGEFIDWALARRRFSSISELDSSRVLALYLRIRRQPLTVESLTEDLAIPQARATSMVGRLKYGEARALAALSFAAAASEVEARLGGVSEVGGRKSITVDRDIVDRIGEVAFSIMSAPGEDHNRGGRFESAEQPTVISSGRWGATVTASPKMWEYIVSELQARGGT